MISNLPAGAIYQKYRRVSLAATLRGHADEIFTQAAALVKARGARFLPLFIVQPSECAKGAYVLNPGGLKTSYASFLPFCPRDPAEIEGLRFPSDGHWSPEGARWGGRGGRVYTTALGALCLEVYYRYLPILVAADRSSANGDP